MASKDGLGRKHAHRGQRHRADQRHDGRRLHRAVHAVKLFVPDVDGNGHVRPDGKPYEQADQQRDDRRHAADGGKRGRADKPTGHNGIG